MDLLIGQLWARRWTIVLLALSGAMVAAIAAVMMTKTYRASIVLAPRDHGEAVAGFRSDSAVAGLAALAGVSVPGGSRRDEDFAFLVSRGLKLRFIEAQGLTSIFFPEDAGIEQKSAQDALRKLNSAVLAVSRDKSTGLVTVTFDWEAPELAALWAEAFVSQANAELAARALNETDNQIAYLEEKASTAAQIEVQQVVYRLLESQLKSRMLAAIGGEFAFKTIDPAIVPDLNKPIRPRRVPMVVGGALLGSILAACWVALTVGLFGRKSAEGTLKA